MILIFFAKREVLWLVNLMELRFELILSCLFLFFAVQKEWFSEEEGWEPWKNEEGEGFNSCTCEKEEGCDPWKYYEDKHFDPLKD